MRFAPLLTAFSQGEMQSVFAEYERLRLHWYSARQGNGLPFYEDVALGGLGPVADRLALLTEDAAGRFRFLRAGPEVETQIGHSLDGMGCEDLAANYRAALEDCLRRAVETQAPASGLARCVLDGFVATCELLGLPLRNRWGGDLILLYVRQRPATHDLVQAIYRSTSDGLIALAGLGEGSSDPDFQVVSLNGAAARLFGKPEAEARWQLLSDLIPGWGQDRLRDDLVAAMTQQTPSEFEYTIRRSTGERRHLRVSVAPLGELLGIALTDVTGMKQREDSVRVLFESNPMPLLVYDRDALRIRSVNDAMASLCGRPASALIGLQWPDLFADDDRRLVATDGASGRRDGHRSWRIESAGGGNVLVEIYANDLVFGGEQCVLASIHDVTEKESVQAQIAYLAHHDDLTGLCNRVLFRARLQEGLSRCRTSGRKLAVHCIDLDLFKRVNDTLGHQAGDKVLRCVADRISALLGPSDLAARLGGDEFAVIQVDLSSSAEAETLAEQLIARISAPYPIDSHQAEIGASIGISLAPDDGLEPDIVLHNADIALYRSKSEGRGILHFFEAGMDTKLQHRRSLEADLRLALGKNEFELFYQPIVSAETLAIEGCEALLRWFHPERGAVSPADFIPIAEEIGLIDVIGEWVLRQACREASGWPEEWKLALNISAAQFRRGNLAATVASALLSAGLQPSRLELEITESAFLSDSANHLATLREFRDLGVSLSLDDFGTGYSSLAYLSRFPIDKIKIDRSFIRDMAESPHGLAIIRAVVSLGRSLGIRTLAEGVETPEQLTRLRDEGCKQLQGFLLGRPMPAPRLTALWTAASARQIAAA